MNNYYQVIEEPKIIDILKEISEGTLGEGTSFDYDGHRWVYDKEDECIRTKELDYYDADVKTYLYLEDQIDLSNLNDKVSNFQRVYNVKLTSTSTCSSLDSECKCNTTVTKIKPTIWHFTTTREVRCCPVCGGNGMVSNGFYNHTGNTWVTSTTAPEQCRSCGGKGYVEI